MVVDSSLEPQHKNVMIANINGEQTVKQLWIDGENIQLIPKNSRHKPIEMQKGMDFRTQGMVTWVIWRTGQIK